MENEIVISVHYSVQSEEHNHKNGTLNGIGWLAQLVRRGVSRSSNPIDFRRNASDEMSNGTNIAHQPLNTSSLP